MNISRHKQNKSRVPFELLTKLKSAGGIFRFIETGTGSGKTAIAASEFFEFVTTIEADPELYKKVVAEYVNYTDIEFVYGDSSEILKKVLKEKHEPMALWLDAVGTNENQDKSYKKQTSILNEIEAVNDDDYDHIIMIANAGLYMIPPDIKYKSEQIPAIAEIFKALSKRNRYVIIDNDVIISVPVELELIVREHYDNIQTLSGLENSSADEIREKESLSEQTEYLEKLRIDFRDTKAMINLAKIEIKNGNNEKALRYLIAVMQLEPENEIAKNLWNEIKPVSAKLSDEVEL